MAALAAVLAICTSLHGCTQTGQTGPRRLGPTDPPGYLPAQVAAKAADFRGTCSWGRAPGDPGIYRLPLRVRPSPSGTVLVRASALFDLTDSSNILGELPSGTVAMGDGPVYDSKTRRRGYAILVRGVTGRVCRGYVTETSVLADCGMYRARGRSMNPALRCSKQ